MDDSTEKKCVSLSSCQDEEGSKYVWLCVYIYFNTIIEVFEAAQMTMMTMR